MGGPKNAFIASSALELVENWKSKVRSVTRPEACACLLDWVVLNWILSLEAFTDCILHELTRCGEESAT